MDCFLAGNLVSLYFYAAGVRVAMICAVFGSAVNATVVDTAVNFVRQESYTLMCHDNTNHADHSILKFVFADAYSNYLHSVQDVNSSYKVAHVDVMLSGTVDAYTDLIVRKIASELGQSLLEQWDILAVTQELLIARSDVRLRTRIAELSRKY